MEENSNICNGGRTLSHTTIWFIWTFMLRWWTFIRVMFTDYKLNLLFIYAFMFNLLHFWNSSVTHQVTYIVMILVSNTGFQQLHKFKDTVQHSFYCNTGFESINTAIYLHIFKDTSTLVYVDFWVQLWVFSLWLLVVFSAALILLPETAVGHTQRLNY